MNSFFASFAARVGDRGPRCLHQQRHRTELVQREKTRVRRARLHRQWRFELQKVLEVARRQTRPSMAGRGAPSGSAPGLSQRRRRNCASGIAAPTVPRLSKSRREVALCSSPNMKSFVASTPICRDVSSKYRPFRSATVSAGHVATSSASSRGDHPPQYTDRPPIAYARPLNGIADFHGMPQTSLRAARAGARFR